MKTALNLSRPDDVYEMLLDVHVGLSEADSSLLNSQLILLLANQVGDDDTVVACIRAAREGITDGVSPVNATTLHMPLKHS